MRDMYDVIVVGGGAAGLSAALILGRARRRALVIDAGEPRNAPSHESHSFFTRDGAPPRELVRIGREQAAAYGVEVREGRATDASRLEDGSFEVTLEDGERVCARRLLLATGVVDELPDIPGFAERWGKSVLHCPYCHGWEIRDQPFAILVNGPGTLDFVALLHGWSRDLTVCTNGPAELDDETRAKLARHGVPVREEPIAALEGPGEALERVVFAQGEPLACAALFHRPDQRPAGDLAHRLGCARRDDGMLQLDMMYQSSVPGVYIAGDLTRRMQQVGAAAAQGAHAAAGINHALLMEEFD